MVQEGGDAVKPTSRWSSSKPTRSRSKCPRPPPACCRRSRVKEGDDRRGRRACSAPSPRATAGAAAKPAAKPLLAWPTARGRSGSVAESLMRAPKPSGRRQAAGASRAPSRRSGDDIARSAPHASCSPSGARAPARMAGLDQGRRPGADATSRQGSASAARARAQARGAARRARPRPGRDARGARAHDAAAQDHRQRLKEPRTPPPCSPPSTKWT